MSWDWEKLKEQQGRRGGGKPPQMDDLFKKLNEIKLPGGNAAGLILILLAIAGYLAYTMVFTVEVDEFAVVQRFGKYTRTAGPGLHFKLPQGVEQVTRVKVKRVYREEFGFRSMDNPREAQFASVAEKNDESLMLTGDLNVAVVPWIVQYRIDDPYLYLFKVRNVIGLLRDMSEATMRLVVGDRSINEVINKRNQIATKAQKLLQEEMKQAETGIEIITIEMEKTNVPEKVRPYFNEVNQAIQEKEKMIYQAREEYNKAIPAAEGNAERVIKTAEGYRLDRVNRAKGAAARFRDLYKEYEKAPEVMKRRLYLETMQQIYPKLDRKFLIDLGGENLLPLLNLTPDKESIPQ